jgi:uncharacterized protein (DUF885 family)
MQRALLASAALLVPFGASWAKTPNATPAQRVEQLADRFVSEQLAYDPTIAYQSGLETKVHDRFPDRTPKALNAYDQAERADLAALRAIDPAKLPLQARATYANLREQLESDLQMRVCKAELWNVNHFSGWQSNFADVADAQPVATADDRAQALKRWSSLPRYIDVEIANLKQGLAEGYSAPKSVVRRMIAQMDGLAKAAPEDSPFYSPATRTQDPAFKAQFRQVVAAGIDPALIRYRDFLQTEYLPKAREGVAISDLPNGPACYQAFLRAFTTLQRTPQQVFDLGRQTVAANLTDIQAFGQRDFQTADVATLLARIKADPAEHFQSKDELLAFSGDFLAQAKAKTAEKLIAQMPAQDAVVEPERPFEDQAGVSSHYDPQPDTHKPATFRIELGDWATETRGEAEITAAHEVWPGHHLQISLARDLQPPTRFAKIAGNSAYIEGWARYAEAMAEEAGIYHDRGALILRRIWPARGMVVDPGLHAFHWTRQQAIDYLVATGRFNAKSADDAVDRIAVIPGQLTAYDSGGLEIRALRQEAREKLGTRFDLKAFNRTVLEEGVVPLSELKAHVEDWIARGGG